MRGRDLPSILSGYEKWDGKFGLFAAHGKSSCDFVGWFHLRPEQGAPQDEVELGYRLRQAEWGKGMEKMGMALAERIPTPPDMQMCEGGERGGVLYQVDREGWRAAVATGG